LSDPLSVEIGPAGDRVTIYDQDVEKPTQDGPRMRSVSVVNLRMQKAKVIALGTAVAVAYGIVHDQITVRLCIEYFSLAHPPLFPVSSPTLLGLCWGIAATFGVGLILGYLLAQASQSAGLPPMAIRSLLCPLLVVIAVTAAGAIVAGCLGFDLSRRGLVSLPNLLPNWWVATLSRAQQDRFMAVWFAHAASYLFGVVSAAVLILRIWLKRGRPRLLPFFPRSGLEILRLLLLLAVFVIILSLRLLRSAE
jgi:hypothetical protein